MRRQGLPEEERFWGKVEKTDGCWIWRGSINGRGYGVFHFRPEGRKFQVYAHRYAYEKLRGAIPAGLELDHLCRNTVCINPEHLEPVTHQVNLQRGIGGEVSRQKAEARTHCRRGHPYTPENTYWRSKVHRVCRTCQQASKKLYALQKGKK